ncbi:hypothetical protein [Listeria monocytogenes]|uniref:hypothetical protein n=1 Tax=Listeria monocytogenes TaxID=1639 RepID=UPI001778A08F|nr:hypothetical protein [Listeria monocytogenes]MDA5986454.1 hypothetical protein [Listeria monocytogenes]HAA4213643.1 hypothetical protein [Listeria monocytogenes]HAB7539364.1 hypothetical protein [Listeria monocytogenes]
MTFLQNNLIPITVFIVSLVTFYFALSNYLNQRPKLRLQQRNLQKTSIIIEPDRNSDIDPDIHHHIPYRVICEVVLTNDSSLPISIIEFNLNNELVFNSYSQPGSKYEFSSNDIKTLPEHENSIRGYGKHKIKETFPVGEYTLKPIIKLEPYSSVRGYLYFKFRDKEQVCVGENKLQVTTSRKTFNFDIMIDESLYRNPSSL